MDAYLERFERFAKAQGWDEGEWPVYLSALLTGKGLEAYSRMSSDDAHDYDKLKEAILYAYELTNEGFRRKFRESKPEATETPSQFVGRLRKG